MEPLTPKDVISAERKEIPFIVIQIVNELIKEKWEHSNKYSKVNLATIKSRLQDHFPDKTTTQMVLDGWLDIEDLYESYGWDVTFVATPYFDIGPKHFIFREK